MRDYIITARLQKPRDFKTDVHVICGIPGSGKSRYCQEVGGDSYWKPCGKWWDGYIGQETVVLDDFCGWLPISDLLRLMDRYPFRVETVEFVSKKIYITSNKSSKEWYKEELNLDMRPPFRRFATIHVMRRGVLPHIVTPDLPINC